MPAVYSVAYRAPDHSIRRAALRPDEVRRICLDFCFRVPGYAEKPTDEKNRIYDALREILGA